MTTRDILAPKPGDEALLEKMLADEAGTRHTVVLLEVLSLRGGAQGVVMREAADAIRTLFNAVKEARVEA